MSFYLGNLTVSQIESRAGVTFPEELKTLMEKTHQPSATNIGEREWHCFDIPFVLVCGGMEIATEIHGHLRDLGGDFREPLQIALKSG